MSEIGAILAALRPAPARPAVLATLVAVSGSSYRRPGARLLMVDGRPAVGAISGGCLEEDAAIHAGQVAATGVARTITYDTSQDNDLVWGTGLGCHGLIQVLLEPVPAHAPWPDVLSANLAAGRPTELAVTWRHADPAQLGTRLAGPETSWTPGIYRETLLPPPRLAIFGAGDDAIPLATMAATLGWQTVVADVRPAFATAARFPGAAAVIVGGAESLVARVSPAPDSFAVIMTHHYLHDRPLLRDLLGRPLAYLGLLGPRQRAVRLLQELGPGTSPDPLPPHLHAPVGLDLGADNAAEIALAILAEMQAALRQRDARPLRDRLAPIHG